MADALEIRKIDLPASEAAASDETPALVRLAALHDEAQETAVLANLLGRAPYAAAMLATLAILTIAIAGIGAVAETAVWALLIAGAAISLARIYAHAIRAPFERATLKSFREDAKAALLYAGFAWGAGAFLALPPATGPVLLALFAAGGAAVMAVLLQDSGLTLAFSAPAIALPAAAAVLRPLAAGTAGLGLALLAGACVIAVAWIAGRLSGRSGALPPLAGLKLS